MKTKLALATLMVSMLPIVAACSPVSGASADKETHIDVSADDFATTNSITREITVSEGDTLTVSLGSNPSTGFGWDEATHPGDILRRLP